MAGLIETFTDRHALRYWTLIVDGCERSAVTEQATAAWERYAQALRAHPSRGSQTRRPLTIVFARAAGSASGLTRPTVVGLQRFDGEADETDRKEDHVVSSWGRC